MKSIQLTEERLGQLALELLIVELEEEGLQLKEGWIKSRAERIARGLAIDNSLALHFLEAVIVPGVLARATKVSANPPLHMSLKKVWEIALGTYKLRKLDHGLNLPAKREIPNIIKKTAPEVKATEDEVLAFHVYIISSFLLASIPGCLGCTIEYKEEKS